MTGLTDIGAALAATDLLWVSKDLGGGSFIERKAAISRLDGRFGKVASPLSQFAATTSAQLAGIISDATGTGALVLANSPALITPNIGTPSTGNLSNCDTFPLTELTGAGTGVLTFLATPSSANLRAALTDETGSGAAVFATSPTLVTPVLGVASCTTLQIPTGSVGAPSIFFSGDSDTGMCQLNAGNNLNLVAGGVNQIGINTSGITFANQLAFSGTTHAGIQLNSLTTTQRDALTGVAGNLIWNSTTARMELYIGSAWKNFVRLDGDTMTGSLLFTDNTLDIGATGATRPRTLYLGTSAIIQKGAIGATATDGLQLINSTAAALGAQQYSTALRFTGQGWKTNATAASEAVDWRIYSQPVQGAADPTANLLVDFSVNGGAFSNKLTLSSAGGLTAAAQIGVGSTFLSANQITTTSIGLISFNSRSYIASSADGMIDLYNNGFAGFTRLNIGGITSAFPAIGRNGIFLEFLAADGSSTASTALYNTKTSGTNFERLTSEWSSNVCRLWTEKGSGGGTARALVLGADATELMRFGSATTLSFFGATAVARATGGENVTNNVTDTASTAGTIPDITNGTVYATDYTNLRNALFQLARLVKQDHDALRAYGLLT